MAIKCADCTFVVKEDDKPYIQIEPTISRLDIAFKLKEGTTIDDAQGFARQMRDMIVSVLLTSAGEPFVPNFVEGSSTKQ